MFTSAWTMAKSWLSKLTEEGLGLCPSQLRSHRAECLTALLRSRSAVMYQTSGPWQNGVLYAFLICC